MKHARSAAVLTAAAGTVLAVAVAGCSSGSSGSSGSAASSGSGSGHVTLTLVSDSDTNIQELWKTKLIPAFEKANPGTTLKFSNVTSTDEAPLFARIVAAEKANRPAPVDVFVDDGFIPQAQTAGILYPFDSSSVPNMGNIISVDQGPAGEVAYRGSAVVVAYNSQKVSSPPTTLSAVLAWVKAHPGQFSYCNPADGGSGKGFVQAVLDQSLDDATVKNFAAGEDTADQSKWSAGWATLKSLTRDVYQHTYPTGNTQVLNLLAQGQISLATVWSDQFLAAVQQGAVPSYIKAVSISAPAMPGGPAFLAAPKNASSIPAVKKLLNWVLEPAQQALMVTQISGYPAIGESSLPSSVQSAFGQLDTSLEAPFYSDQAAADMLSQWQRNVP